MNGVRKNNRERGEGEGKVPWLVVGEVTHITEIITVPIERLTFCLVPV
jgi:hypothetical protein